MSAKRARERRRTKALRWARQRLFTQWIKQSDGVFWMDYGAFEARYPWLPAPVDAYATAVTFYGNVGVMR